MKEMKGWVLEKRDVKRRYIQEWELPYIFEQVSGLPGKRLSMKATKGWVLEKDDVKRDHIQERRDHFDVSGEQNKGSLKRDMQEQFPYSDIFEEVASVGGLPEKGVSMKETKG